MFKKKKKKCLACDSENINELKPSKYRQMQDQFNLTFRKATKTLNVCKDCKFSWEDR